MPSRRFLPKASCALLSSADVGLLRCALGRGSADYEERQKIEKYEEYEAEEDVVQTDLAEILNANDEIAPLVEEASLDDRKILTAKTLEVSIDPIAQQQHTRPQRLLFTIAVRRVCGCCSPWTRTWRLWQSPPRVSAKGSNVREKAWSVKLRLL